MKYFALIAFVGFVSCSNQDMVSNNLAISPVENIQLSFDLIGGKDAPYKDWASSKGNVFEITDLPKLNAYINDNKKALLIADNYEFLWDTVHVSKKLYLVNNNKSHVLDIKSVTYAKDTTLKQVTTLQLTSKSKISLSRFFATNIGKGLVLLNPNGFVASAEKISRLDNGNLSFTK
jgi:uncharacterized protein with ATP-grasp and redox domains